MYLIGFFRPNSQFIFPVLIFIQVYYTRPNFLANYVYYFMTMSLLETLLDLLLIIH